MKDRDTTDRNTDTFIRQILRETVSEKAPDGFRHSVMERIRAERKLTPSGPLISWRAWAVIAAGVAGLAVWALNTGRDTGAGQTIMESLFQEVASFRLPAWELPEIPVTFVYGAAFLLLFGLFQLAWMKRYLSDRLSV